MLQEGPTVQKTIQIFKDWATQLHLPPTVFCVTEVTRLWGESLLSVSPESFTFTFTSFSIKIFSVLPSAIGTRVSVDVALSQFYPLCFSVSSPRLTEASVCLHMKSRITGLILWEGPEHCVLQISTGA